MTVYTADRIVSGDKNLVTAGAVADYVADKLEAENTKLVPIIKNEWDSIPSEGYNTYEIGNMVYVNNKFIAVGDSGCYYSEDDGQTWKTGTFASISEGQIITSMAYGNDKFLASCISPDPMKTYIFSSQYGYQDWNSLSEIDGVMFYYLIFTHDTFIGFDVIGQTVYTSLDGNSWSQKGSYGLEMGESLLSIAYGDDSDGNPVIIISNGSKISINRDLSQTWSVKSDLGFEANCIAYGNGLFMIVSYRDQYFDIHTSSNYGDTWSLINSWKEGSIDLSNLAFGSSVFTFGSLGNIYMSWDNGVTWSKHNYSNNGPKKIEYGNNIFVAIDGNHQFLVSKCEYVDYDTAINYIYNQKVDTAKDIKSGETRLVTAGAVADYVDTQVTELGSRPAGIEPFTQVEGIPNPYTLIWASKTFNKTSKPIIIHNMGRSGFLNYSNLYITVDNDMEAAAAIYEINGYWRPVQKFISPPDRLGEVKFYRDTNSKMYVKGNQVTSISIIGFGCLDEIVESDIDESSLTELREKPTV